MYNSGYIEGVAVDQARSSWRSTTPRPLVWAAWYPVEPDTAVTDRLIGLPGTELFRMGLVAENAAISSAQRLWPVVLLSHGTGGSVQGLSWLGTHLASKGFISVGVSHHGNTVVEPYLPEGFLCWWERARDLTVILDLLADDGPLADRLDMTNVFAAGFSLGGYTVLLLAGAATNLRRFDEWRIAKGDAGNGPREFPDLGSQIAVLNAESEQFCRSMERHSQSYFDLRIRAVMAYAPAPPVRSFEPASVAEIIIPTKIIVGQDDTEAPHDECALWLQQLNPNFNVTVMGGGVGHYAFLPEATNKGRALEPVLCSDNLGVNRLVVHQSSAEATERHFRHAMSVDA